MITIREMRSEEIEAAIGLVREVFEEFVRPDISDEGWAKLLEYIDVDAARARNSVDHQSFVAESGGRIVGMIEIRLVKHVSLLVVDKRSFGQGIARRLFERGLEYCREQNPSLESLTVHSSRYAIDVYRRLGFEAIGEEMVVDGIRFTPMALRVTGSG